MWRGAEIWPVEHKPFRHSTMRSGSSSSSSRFKIRPKQVNASTCDFERCCLQSGDNTGTHLHVSFRGKLYVDQSNSCTYLRVWRARCLSFRDHGCSRSRRSRGSGARLRRGAGAPGALELTNPTLIWQGACTTVRAEDQLTRSTLTRE